MKYVFLLILSFICLAVDTFAQKGISTIDSLEYNFERLTKNKMMPCQWVLTIKHRTNGQLRYYDRDSTALEFEFFKASSLPFYTSSQTDFETTQHYYDWTVNEHVNTESLKLTKLQENKTEGYAIFKIIDLSGEFYRLLARHNEILYSIKIYNKKTSTDKKLYTLIQLHDLNKP